MSRKKVIEVSISGEPNVGKTTIAKLLFEVLKKHKILAVVDDEVEKHEIIHRNFNNRCADAIKDKTIVRIKTIGTRSWSQEDNE
jgi:uridine kinase